MLGSASGFGTKNKTLKYNDDGSLTILRMSAFSVAIGGKADMVYCSAHVCF